MKSLTRTIIVLVIFNLVTGNLALAQAEGQSEPIASRRDRRSTSPELTVVEPIQAEPSMRTVKISGSTGLQGVVIYGLPGNPVTGVGGYYTATVHRGWSGTVMPVKKGYRFEPPKRHYADVIDDQPNQDYSATVIHFIISGTTGLSGVMMQGLPGDPVTDEKGYYRAEVDYGWSGTVTPTKEGYTFGPARMIYAKITTNRSNDNYAPTLITYTISGTTGLSGVMMQGLPGGPVTDEKGYYSAVVEYGWTGLVKPTKEGFTFVPPKRQYTPVAREQTNQNYSPRRIGPAPMLGRTGGRKVLVIPITEVKTEDLVAITQDLQVMSHIFDERFKQPRLVRGRLVGKVFTDFGDFFGRDSRATEAIYLQGYGVLFLMEVNFAFSPPPKAQEKQAEETEDVDPTWQRAKQQIFSPKGFGGGSEFFSEERDNAEKIKVLKTELIKTLKHAANIRNLKPDEWVILTVIGQGRQPGGVYEDYYRSAAPRSGTSTSRRRSSSGVGGSMYGGIGGMGMGGFGGGYSVSGGSAGFSGGFGGGCGFGGLGYESMEYGEMGPPSATVLTIRAKKSDVDAFAKGELDFEQFQQKVEIFTY